MPRPPDSQLIPLINVIFLLLILFMTTSRLLPQESATIRLPETQRTLAARVAPRIVQVDAAGQLTLDGAPTTLEALGTMRAAAAAPLALEADARVPVEHLRAILERLRAAGVATVELTVVAKTHRE